MGYDTNLCKTWKTERGVIMWNYDSWLSKQADAYWEPCEPELDRDGEYTKCIECLDKCEQYYEIFGKPMPELNEDIAEFFWKTCERFK